ncbi:MAG: hypothetical protein OES32_07520 [Acidobacteriota bacterium]|nr:hypothetical protein [Acidobacteriota bacterium]
MVNVLALPCRTLLQPAERRRAGWVPGSGRDSTTWVRDLQLGRATGELYEAYRGVVDYVDRDRPFTPDIQRSYELIRCYPERLRNERCGERVVS